MLKSGIFLSVRIRWALEEPHDLHAITESACPSGYGIKLTAEARCNMHEPRRLPGVAGTMEIIMRLLCILQSWPLLAGACRKLRGLYCCSAVLLARVFFKPQTTSVRSKRSVFGHYYVLGKLQVEVMGLVRSTNSHRRHITEARWYSQDGTGHNRYQAE